MDLTVEFVCEIIDQFMRENSTKNCSVVALHAANCFMCKPTSQTPHGKQFANLTSSAENPFTMLMGRGVIASDALRQVSEFMIKNHAAFSTQIKYDQGNDATPETEGRHGR